MHLILVPTGISKLLRGLNQNLAQLSLTQSSKQNSKPRLQSKINLTRADEIHLIVIYKSYLERKSRNDLILYMRKKNLAKVVIGLLLSILTQK